MESEDNKYTLAEVRTHAKGTAQCQDTRVLMFCHPHIGKRAEASSALYFIPDSVTGPTNHSARKSQQQTQLVVPKLQWLWSTKGW